MVYTGAKGGSMYDPNVGPIVNITKEQYAQQTKDKSGTAINHFYGKIWIDGFWLVEKLFTLKDLMLTESGKEIALERHEYMVKYVQRFENECRGLI